MDWFSFIISFLTILVPSLVSIFTLWNQYKINKDNNNHLLETEKLKNENQLNLKRLDYYYSERNSAIFKYLDALINYLNIQSQENLSNYQSAVAKVSMYTSDETYDHIFHIDMLIENKNFDDAKEQIKCLMDALSFDSKHYK